MANITPFGLRMQPELKARLEQSARENNRSLNAEIATRVEQFDGLQADLKTATERMLSLSRDLRIREANHNSLVAERDAARKEVEVLRQEYAALRQLQMEYKAQAKMLEVIADRLNSIDRKLGD